MEIYKTIDALHLKLGCKIQEFEGGAGLPTSYSDRLAEEINLLLHGCGLFDLKSSWLIAIKGAEAGTFLQGMVTSDVLKLEIGQMQSSLICANKGKILHHLEIIRSLENEWIVSCDPGEGRAVGTILDNFHVREELEMRLLNSGEMLRIDLIGPDAEKNLVKLGYSPQKADWKFEGGSVYSVKLKLGKLPRWINLLDINVMADFIKLMLKRDNVDLTGLEAFDEIRILEGIPRFGVDYSTDNFPQEAGLADHISFKKGCYIGQEPHARMYHRGHPNWISVWLKLPEESEASSGDALFHDGKEIGKITSLTGISARGLLRGIAMIRHELTQEKNLFALAVDSQPIIQHEALSNTIV
jgi:folate-binding protein YgfZ